MCCHNNCHVTPSTFEVRLFCLFHLYILILCPSLSDRVIKELRIWKNTVPSESFCEKSRDAGYIIGHIGICQ